MNTQEIFQFLLDHGIQWVESQKHIHEPEARCLSEDEKSHFASFYQAETLERARLKLVPRIEEPTLFDQLRQRGMSHLLNWPIMDGITYGNIVLVVQSKLTLRRLFHELVHVVQYEVFGIREFMRLYVSGAWDGKQFNYDTIPLERHAYALDASYSSDPERPFSVKEEILRQRKFYITG